MQRILVFTATYNEADNIAQLVYDILRYLPIAEVFIVDDASPDGTGSILDQMSQTNSKLHVLHRPRKLGLGTAHKLAMKYAMQHNFDILVTMDADFSHHPRYLPDIVAQLADHDFVIGSRYMPGGKSGYGFARTLLSRTANMLTRGLLRIPLHECTTSYRGFRVSLLRQLNLDTIRSNGYSFFVETLFYISLLTRRITEVAIYFEDRRAGASKISHKEILKGFTSLLRLFFKKTCQLSALMTKIHAQSSVAESCCPNCHNPFLTEIYPATRQQIPSFEVYRCTSDQHSSHGLIGRCLECGLVYDATPLSQQEMDQIYTTVEDPVYVENLAARYETFRYNLKQILAYLPEQGRLLDVGTYCGAFLKIAQEAGFDAVGVEPSTWAVTYATNVLQQKVFTGTIHDLPDDIQHFDVITLWDVLEHFADPFHELEAIHKRLKPDGIFALSTLNVDNWYPKLLGERWPWYMDMHLYYFTRETLHQILEKAGFDMLHSQSYCHIITLDYLLFKLDALGFRGITYLRKLLSRTSFRKWFIPFRFGDIQLVVCRKRENKCSHNIGKMLDKQ